MDGTLPERVAALEARLDANDQRTAEVADRLRELRGAEEEHRAITDRLAILEGGAKSEEAGDRSRRDRLWVMALTLVSGVVFPLLVTMLITFLHLQSTSAAHAAAHSAPAGGLPAVSR